MAEQTQEQTDLDGDLNVAELGSGGDGDLAGAQAELEAMRERLAAMEAESNKLREYQAKQEAAAGIAPQAEGSGSQDTEAKAEADARSVFVGNVDYAVTPEELQLHFQSCGTVNRVTILTDRMGNPKAFAYIEFLEPEAVPNAVLLNDSTLHGRQLKVTPKRTNVPGLKARGRGRGFRGGGRGYYGRGPPRGGGYGYAPRGRRGRFYSPY